MAKRNIKKYRQATVSYKKLKANNQIQIHKMLVVAFILLVATLGGSYAYLTTSVTGEKEAEIVAGTLRISFTDKNRINLSNAYPMSDSEGLSTQGYKFTITNEGNITGKYQISLEEKAGNTLDKSNIRYAIRENGGEYSEAKYLNEGLILTTGTIEGTNGNNEKTFELKMWLKSDAANEVQGQTYSAKIVVDTVQQNIDNITVPNPVIRLSGSSVERIVQGTTYTDSGVNSIISDEDLSIENISKRYEYYDGENTIQVDGVDTTKIGIYYIYYEITDSNGLKGVATRVVNVYKVNTTPPTITLVGSNPVTLNATETETYVEPGYTASDSGGVNLTDRVIVVGTINTNIPGTQTIKYIVIDEYGNIASVTRDVVIGKTVTITLDNQGATTLGTTSINVGYNATLPNITVPTKTGHTFLGYYSVNSSDDATKKYYDASGHPTKTSDFAEDKVLYAMWQVNTYTVTYDSQNLLYGLDDTDGWDTSNSGMEYKVENGVVTVKAKQNDGYGLTNGRVYLETGKTYIFSSETNGVWGAGQDTVEMFLCMNGSCRGDNVNTFNKRSSNNYEFTPTTTGTYWLRLDVNQNGATHTFSNITVEEKIADSTVTYGSNVDLSKSINKNGGYQFLGWNTDSDATSGLSSLSMPAEDITLYAIYSKTATITFNKNGATSQTVSGGSADTGATVTQSCTMYNDDLGCNITSPTITASSNTPTVIGYSLDSATHTSKWNQNTVKRVSSSATYYAQTKSEEQTLSVDFSRNTTEISAINNGTTRISCTVGESYNGVAQATSCNASTVTPSMTANEGYVKMGWFTSNTGTINSSSTPALAESTSFVITTGSTNTSVSPKQIKTGTTLYARARYVVASEVGYSNANTGLKDSAGNNCTDTQCALDRLMELIG